MSPGWAIEIDSDTTTPIETSTANSGAPDDVTITDDGEIDISDQEGAAAVTIDSDNNLVIDGVLMAEDTDNVTGVRVITPTVSDITLNGSITLTEDYTREDEDDDDDLDGPLAIGENRNAILVEPGGTLTGDLTLGVGSSITVEGNDSAAILVGGALDGSFISDGSISVTGDNARGLQFDDDVSGDVLISGSVFANGENASGVVLSGDLGGALTIDTTITSTGFTSTSATNYVAPSRITDDTPPVEERRDEDDLYDNSVAVEVTGSVADGILINGSVDDFVSEEDAEDETKDTVDDFDENRTSAAIISYGSGEALRIAAETPGEDIVIGPVVETVRDTLDDDEDDDVGETLATFTFDQGLINRGTITADGVNIGFNATALSIAGLADGSATVTIEGGVLNTGGITARAFEADALALRIGPSVIVGTLDNDGSISSTIATTENNSAVGVLIEDGATLDTVLNSGSISASSTGYGGQVAALRDESGTLTYVENTGTISARLLSDGETDDGDGVARAIDLSATDADVTIEQYERTPVEDINGDGDIDNDDTPDPVIIGDVVFGSGDDVFRLLDGAMAGDTDFGTGAATFVINSTNVVGDTMFGGDTFSLQVSGGSTVAGDFNFGAGAGSVSILSGSTVEGAFFSDAGSSIAFNINGSEVGFLADTALNVDSLTVANGSTLGFTVDPKNPHDAAYITVAGEASIGGDTTIVPVLASLTTESFSAPLIEASSIAYSGDLSDISTDQLPYLYDVSLSEEAGGTTTTLNIDFRLKTPEELGLDINQGNALDAVLELATSDDEVGAALGAISERAPFLQSYNLLLPNRTDASTRYLESQSNASFGALREHLTLNRLTPSRTSGFWLQQSYTRLEADPDTQTPGYNGRGLGVAIGADRKMLGFDAVGLMVTMTDGRFEEKTGGVNPVTMTSYGLGAYVAESLGPLNLQLVAQHAMVDFSSTRRVYIDEYYSVVSGTWEGSSDSASALATLDIGSGLFRMEPRIGVDYFSLSQDAYSEVASNGLNLAVSDSETDRFTASAGVGFSAVWSRGPNGTAPGLASTSAYGWSRDTTYRVNLDLGYRSVLSSTPYEVSANFVGYDETFMLEAQDEASDAFTAGVSFLASSDLLSLKFGAGAEVSDEATAATVNATLRIRF